MATNPAYASAGVTGQANFGAVTADGFPSITPSNTQTLLTGAASVGTKCYEISVIGYGTNAACLVNIWLYISSTFYLRDTIQITSAVTASTTAPGASVAPRQYTRLFIPASGLLKASCSVTNQPLSVIAFGADLT